MGFACFPDPAEFARRARPLLDADPVRHNVALGILSSLRDHPGRYASFALWAVEDAAGRRRRRCTPRRSRPSS